MTGIERLRKLAGDLNVMKLWFILASGTEGAHGVDSTSNVTLTERLREIADQIEREGEPRSTDTTISAYDLLSEESQRALEWVRDNGGVDAIERRLLPEGYEWPRFKDNEPVGFGDTGLDVHGHERRAEGVEFSQGGFVFIKDGMGDTWWGNDVGPLEDVEINPNKRVKRSRKPVLAADGEPLEVGQTVWDGHGDKLTVLKLERDEDGHVLCHYEDPSNDISSNGWWFPCQLTHTEPDSWERIEDDIAEAGRPDDYCRLHHIDTSDTSYENAMARDIVRRARALAERGA